jgi:hypothetical protein
LNWQIDAGEVWGKAYSKNYFIQSKIERVLNKITNLFSFSIILDDVSVKTSTSNLINVGRWNPTAGLQMDDVLFPHVSHGFRGKVFHIITYHVSLMFLLGLIIINYFEISEPSMADFDAK